MAWKKIFSFAIVFFLAIGASPDGRAAAPNRPPTAPVGAADPPPDCDDETLDPGAVDDVRCYDKSRPLSEIIKKFTEGPAFIFRDKRKPLGEFPLPINSKVTNWIERWRGGDDSLKQYLLRSGLYSDLINHRLEKRGMPNELFFLAMIESGFQNKIKSFAGARGVWQFITPTGQKYGLTIDYWVDERCDPAKSTEAALQYLSNLYGIFGDWHLAAAAYNTGESFVTRKLRETGCRDYWCLCERRALVSETANYIPKIISAAVVSGDLKRYGIGEVSFLAPLQYSTVEVDTAVDLRMVARCAGTSLKEIEFLNPELTWWCTPPGRRYRVNIPVGRTQEFHASFARLSPEEKNPFKTHQVNAGESVASIAKTYGVRETRLLATINGLTEKSRLEPGRQLIVPVPKNPAGAPSPLEDWAPPLRDPGELPLPKIGTPYVVPEEIEENDFQPPEKKPPAQPGPLSPQEFRVYLIEPEDTLISIAQWSGVSAAELKRINQLDDSGQIQYGDEILIPTDSPLREKPLDQSPIQIDGPTRTINYSVRPGDQCYFIARHYGIHSQNIIATNHLDPKCTIEPGQFITLIVPADAPQTLPPIDHLELDRPELQPGPEAVPDPDASPVPAPAVPDLLSAVASPASAAPVADPAPPATASPPPTPAETKIVYHVKSGDSPWTIARDHDVHVADLLAWNRLSEKTTLRLGQELVIYPGRHGPAPGQAATPTPAKSKADVKKKISYAVRSGDTLSTIADQHGVDLKDLKRWNGLKSDRISKGQKLTIYVKKG